MGLLSGKYTIVTGGGTGLGFGVAQRFLEEGAASVTIVGRREDVLQAAAEKLLALGHTGEVRFKTCDVTHEEQVEAAVEAACNDNGQLDVMVSNAGTGLPNAVIDADVAAWSSLLDLNIIGNLLSIKHAAIKMKAAGGSIISISSIEGAAPSKFMGPYSVSKAGAEMLVKNAALELGPFGIRVNCVRPGMVPTEIVAASLPQSLQDTYIEESDLKRAGTPQEIADAVLYFASDMGKWTTGQIMGVCGGAGNQKGADFSESIGMFYGDDKLKEYTNH